VALTELYVNSAGAGAADGSTEADALSWASMVTAINAGGKAGNRYNVKGSISRTTTTDTISGSGTATSPVIIRGYSTVITDGYQGRTNGNGPLVTTNMPALSYTTGGLNLSGTFIIVEAMNVSAARNGNAVSLGADSVIANSNVVNNNTGASVVAILGSGNRATAINNDAALTAASGGLAGMSGGTTHVKFIANRVTGKTAPGIICGSSAVVMLNVIYASTNGIAMTSTAGFPLIAMNTVVGCTVDGIDIITGTTGLQCVFGNLLTDHTGNGLDMVSAANAALAAYNRIDRNGTAINSGTDWVAATSYGHNTTSATQGNEYQNYGGLDFRLNAASPAKAAGLFPYMDIGALQREESAAATTLLIQNKRLVR
jgi:hypothetical protein